MIFQEYCLDPPIDLDVPQNSLSNQYLFYDDFSENQTPGPIQRSLLEAAQLAASRAREAENLFGSLAQLLDEHCSSHARAILPEPQALRNCTSELTTIAAKHFNAYMHGTSAIEKSSPVKTAKVNVPQSYAGAAKRGAQKTPPSTNKRNAHVRTENAKPDDRLFVRLPSNSSLRNASGYAIQTHLKSKLGSQSKLLSNVVSTKTGFALRPSTGNADALNEKLETVDLFGTAPIEKASPWTSYRIKNVPRFYGTINQNLQYRLEPVTTEAVTVSVAIAASATLVSVLPFQENETNPDIPDTTCIVCFPQEQSRLPHILYLFGCRAVTRILSKRSSVLQCMTYWLWHNSRACSSAPRCRLCGSTQHKEKDHNNLCAAPAEHTCPPRCVHCHGPHPADDPTCGLRPQYSNPPKTKSQVFAIRKIFSEARISRHTEAGCIKHSAAPQGISTSHTAQRTSYPAVSQVAGPLTLSAAASKLTIFLNPFEILKTSAGASDEQMELL